MMPLRIPVLRLSSSCRHCVQSHVNTNVLYTDSTRGSYPFNRKEGCKDMEGEEEDVPQFEMLTPLQR